MAQDVSPGTGGVADAFPGAGRRYLATFPAFRFELHFESAASATWRELREDGGPGRFETVAIRIARIAGSMFVVTWQEANGTTVVAVQDFGNGQVLTNITRADGQFLQARGTLLEVARPPSERPD